RRRALAETREQLDWHRIAGGHYPISSPTYFGSMLRQVGQSWFHSSPHSSTRLGMALSPSRLATRQDSSGDSHLPLPCASSTKRERSLLRCAPSRSCGTKSSGEQRM